MVMKNMRLYLMNVVLTWTISIEVYEITKDLVTTISQTIISNAF